MKHRLYLPTFLPVSFPDSMETFLEDMAKKGWFLKKVGYFLSFCQFEKGAPAPVRYHRGMAEYPVSIGIAAAYDHRTRLAGKPCNVLKIFGFARKFLFVTHKPQPVKPEYHHVMPRYLAQLFLPHAIECIRSNETYFHNLPPILPFQPRFAPYSILLQSNGNC